MRKREGAGYASSREEDVEEKEEWLIVDRHFAEHQQMKASLLHGECRSDVLCALADGAGRRASLDAEREALRCVIEELCARGIARKEGEEGEGEGVVVTCPVGIRYRVDDYYDTHPLELASRLAQEDFVMLRRTNDGDGGGRTEQHIVTAACVCFSFNRVPERIGQPLVSVHRSVSGYEESLATPMDRLISGLRPGASVNRSNWDLKWSGNLKAHFDFREAADFYSDVDARPDAVEVLDREGVGRSLYLKVEFQTLLRLTENDAFTLFSIRSFNEVLANIENIDGAAAALAENIRSVDAGSSFAKYKGVASEGVRRRILAYLDSCGAP